MTWISDRMIDYDIQGPARVCAATGRELKPGDRFFAVLSEDAGKVVDRKSVV